MSKDRIVILGGGPAGLACGWKLAEAGHKVTLLERDERVGGQSITHKRGDFRFDLGGHRFFTKYPEVEAEVVDLLGEEKLVTDRKSVIRLNNQYIQYPLELADLLARMSPKVTVRAGLDYLRAAARTRIQGFDDESFEDWIVNRFGRTLYEIYFGMYTEKLWGIPGTRISADWASQRISLINLWDVFVRLLGRKDDTPRTYLSEFIYPKWGIGTITDRMAERLEAAGGTIVCSAEVNKLSLEEGLIRQVHFVDGEGAPQQIGADRVVSTIPLPELLDQMGIARSDEDLRVVNNMRFRALRFLNLTLDFPEVSDNTWIYVPEPKYLFFRVQEPRNWSPFLAPEGKTSLILELACDRGDATWQEDDEVLYRRAIPQLVELGLLKPEQQGLVMDYFSTYMTHAYPIYDLDYKKKIDHATKLCDGVENLTTLGRQGLFRYNNMDQSLKMGFTCAKYWGRSDLTRRVRAVASETGGFEDQDADAAPVDGDRPLGALDVRE